MVGDNYNHKIESNDGTSSRFNIYWVEKDRKVSSIDSVSHLND